jgi:hypothetical protein
MTGMSLTRWVRLRLRAAMWSPPPVMIERVGIDGAEFESGKKIQARPGKGQLQFEFTALGLASSDKIRFKYKLEGFDNDWVDAGQRRVAYSPTFQSLSGVVRSGSNCAKGLKLFSSWSHEVGNRNTQCAGLGSSCCRKPCAWADRAARCRAAVVRVM